MNRKICCIFNYGPHYRESIFKKMDDELNCHFYFGDTVFMDLEKIDYSKLKGYKAELKTFRFKSFTWQSGISNFFFRNYDSYLITGDPRCLSNWLLMLICKIRHKKIYIWAHGLKIPYSSKRAALLIKAFFKNASGGILLYGNYSRNLMIEEGFPPEKLHVIYNSLDHETQYKIRQKQKEDDIYIKYFNNKNPVIIFIGRLIKEKKLELIIEAQKQLMTKGVFINTIFVGQGEMEVPLMDLARKYELVDRIWFYGSCFEEEQNAKLIYHATLTVSPGDIGLTAIHSLVYGTPVITHSNFWKHGPEFEAITAGETGDFFEEDNVNELVVKINKWINSVGEDKDITRMMCYKKVDLFYNPEYQIKLLKSILE